jgi:replicative DNA helicase
MIEEIILENLLYNEEYTRRVLPYLKKEYFNEDSQSLVFDKIKDFIGKYNTPPTQDELLIELRNEKGLKQAVFEAASDLVNKLSKRSKAPSIQWLVENTEKFCKDKALYNAIVEAASMIENENAEVGQIPEILKNALAVSFDTNIGHDFSEMIEQRYKMLHQTKEYRIPFDLKDLNEITCGGLPRKTLTVVSASTGAGKSLFLCHSAARNFLDGKNVLYITMEMAEERICERIDANILNMRIQDLPGLSLQEYTRRLEKILKDCKGRLIVKEFPTASSGVLQFRALLNELRLKKDFVPDIIYVDYINICSSSRYKAGSVNSYQYVKAICEELRGLAIEYNVPIVSATQLNREGTDSSDVGFKEISESHGLAMTVDILWAMIRTEELDEQNVILFKQLKNRFSDISGKLRFVVGVDRSRMKLFDADTPIPMGKNGPLSNGSPRSYSENDSYSRDHDDKNQDYFANKPSLGSRPRSRFSGIKVE